jgi:CelD/BcsL family acetyltransferase involved in cellulose biosynthesis
MRAPWERLWARAGAECFLSFPSMYHSWHSIHRPQGAALRCAVASDDSGVLAILPMVVRRYGLWTYATTCGPRAAECCDVLIESGAASQSIATALLRNFLTRVRPDYLDFDFVRLGSHLQLALQAVRGLRIVETWDNQVPYADLKREAEWSSYVNSLSKRYRADTARVNRRLREQGSVSVEIVSARATPLIPWLFVHKRRWSERTNRRGYWVFSNRYEEFITALFAADPRYLLFALKLDDVPIAVKLLAVNTRSASLILITYDENYRRFSPGNILDESMMQHLFENYRSSDGRHLDVSFGPGVEPFKLHWSRENLQPVSSYRLVSSRWGSARLWVKRALARLSERTRRAH